MQFRLESHKNLINEKSKYYSEQNEEFVQLKNKTNFFSKILTNINIGIEFSKPIQ